MSTNKKNKASASSAQSSRAERSQMKQPKNQSSKNKSAAVATSHNRKFIPANIRNLPSGAIRVKHREYLADVVGPASGLAFNIGVNIPVNPGMSAFSPWLAPIARRFESYMFHALRFVYETEAPTSLGGTLILTLDYDASDAPPGSKQFAMNFDGAVRSAPWTDCSHNSRMENLQKMKTHFVRSSSIPAGTDIKLYDLGNFYAITQNLTANSAVCGELYVEYDVELVTPVYDTDLFPPLGGQVRGSPAGNPQLPFGAVPDVDPKASGIYVEIVGGFTFLRFVNPGTYVLTNQLFGTALAASTYVADVDVSITLGIQTTVINTASTLLMECLQVVVAAGNRGVRMVVPSTATTTNMLVAYAPPGSLI